MAITILHSPQDYSTIYNEIVYVVDSDNKLECQFEYVADIYVNGAYKTRLKLFPNQDGYGLFKVNKVLSNYISFNTHEGSVEFTTNDQSIITYQVKFGESYDTSVLCDQGATLFTNVEVSRILYAFNGVVQQTEYNSYNHYDYIMGNGTLYNGAFTLAAGGWTSSTGTDSTMGIVSDAMKYDSLFDGDALTVTSTATTLTVGMWYKVTYTITSKTSPFDNMTMGVKLGTTVGTAATDVGTYTQYLQCATSGLITLYADNDGQGGTIIMDDLSIEAIPGKFLTNMPNYTYIGLTESYYLNMLNDFNGIIDKALITTYDEAGSVIYTSDIVNIYDASTTERHLLTVACGPADINALDPGIIDSNTATYSVELLNGSETISEVKYFTVDHRCTGLPTKRFLFLGRLGGMESYSFTLRSTRKVKINRTEYSRLSGEYNAGPPTSWTILPSERGRTTLNVTGQDVFEATTNWLSEAEAIWLEELFTSPEVYVFNDEGEIIPVIITSNGYEEITKKQKRMISYKIEYEAATTKNIQNN